jgi:predicted TIM-barrel fold metal-dependent hydrolase
MRGVLLSMSMVLLVSLSAADAAQEALRPLTFVDVHSHFLPNMTLDEEMAMFRQAGVTAVVLMSVPPDRLEEVRRQYPGYIVPFVGFKRNANGNQLPLNPDTLALWGRQLDAGAICGFGETGTMMDPAEKPAASLVNPQYLKLYQLAAAHHAPVTYHVDLDSPEVIDNFGRIARMYPDMPLILAHAGFNAGPEVVAKLLAAHPNIYVDVSIRLDPVNGFEEAHQLGPNRRTMIDLDGALMAEWRALLQRYPDRFMFGMDIAPTGPKGREKRAVDLTGIARKALSVLPAPAQRAIAHGNAEKLLARCKAGPGSH